MLQMLDDFVDVTKDEKQLMHLWNSFVRRQRYSCFIRLSHVFSNFIVLSPFLFNFYFLLSTYLLLSMVKLIKMVVSLVFTIVFLLGFALMIKKYFICAVCWQMLMFPGHVRHFQDFMDRSWSPLQLFSGTAH